MAVWSGLGVNYKRDESFWASDANYFISIGLKNLRLDLGSCDSTWTVGDYTARIGNSFTTNNDYAAFGRRRAKYFKSRGFWVSWGISGLAGQQGANSFTATGWNTYHDVLVAEATYLQQQGIKLDCFELGNELESKCNIATMTVDQFIINMKQLATDVKAVYNLAPIGYSLWDYNVTTHSKWIAAGLGNIDILALHPYGNVGNNGRNLTNGGYGNIQPILSAFGPDRIIINEFNLDANDTNLKSIPDDIQVSRMREKYALIKSYGFTKACVYTYAGYFDEDNKFAMHNTDDSFNSYWDVLLSDNKRRTFVN